MTNIATPNVDSRKQEMNKFTVLINKGGIYVVVLMLLVIGFLASDKFITLKNFSSITQAISLIGICAVGNAFIVYSANFNDMSIPMIISTAGMIAVQMIQYGFVISIISGVVVGTALGLVNGLMMGKFRAHPIIWTMAFNYVLSGIVRWIWSGKQIYPDVVAGSNVKAMEAANTFFSISRRDVMGIPLMVVVMVIMFIAGQFVLTRTRYGNQLKIIGSNYEVARLSGINCVKNIFITYLISAFCASVSGIFIASMAKTGAYSNGDGYDFLTVTAVLLGGMTLAGGKGNLIGVFGGVLAVGMLSNIMTLVGISTFNQWLVKGLMFLFIVWLNTNSSRKLGRT